MPTLPVCVSSSKLRVFRRSASLAVLASAACAVLAGCGAGMSDTTTSGTLSMQGHVMGGQQGVSGSTIQLYTAGKLGNDSAALPMLTRTVTTDRFGSFSITGDYTCGSASDQVYIVARGGNPGLATPTSNAALVLMNALGSCGNLTSSSYITINEVTTAAAAWALAPFSTGYADLGASTTNALGLTNAFLDAHLLADTRTGLAATLASNQAVETGKLYALADALAPCVNSNGGGCAALFAAATPTGGTAPADTLTAALNIVKHPGQNVAAVYAAISAQPPFAMSLTKAPVDWTISMTVSGGGLNAPTSLGVDGVGNVWIANDSGVLSAFSPQGVPYSATGFGSGVLNESFGLTIDPSDNIWVTNYEQPHHSPTRGSVSNLYGASSGHTLGSFNTASNLFYDSSIDYPNALAADTNGDIAISNYATSAATIFTGGGTTVTSGLGLAAAVFPVSIAFDTTHGVWMADQGDDTVIHVAANGTVLAHPTCCNAANTLALDALSNVWVGNYYSDSITEISPAGTVLIDQKTGGGVNHPASLALDGAGNVWVANYHGNSFSEIAGNGQTVAAGTALSPATTGYGTDPTLAVTPTDGDPETSEPALLLPYGLSPDASGNVWVAAYGSNVLMLYFGLAAPTATPLASATSVLPRRP